MNNIDIMGRVCNTPELRVTPSGISIARFNVAVQRQYKDANGERPADFLPVVCLKAAAEFVSKWFDKGAMIAVNGTLHSRQYTDKDGGKHKTFEIVAKQIYFCGGNANNTQQTNELPPAQNEETGDEELPF